MNGYDCIAACVLFICFTTGFIVSEVFSNKDDGDEP